MTNPALDALERLYNGIPYISDQVDNDYRVVKTALANAPQVVTVEKLSADFQHWKLYQSTHRHFGEHLAELYPNGLKITAAPNGGAE